VLPGLEHSQELGSYRLVKGDLARGGRAWNSGQLGHGDRGDVFSDPVTQDPDAFRVPSVGSVAIAERSEQSRRFGVRRKGKALGSWRPVGPTFIVAVILERIEPQPHGSHQRLGSHDPV